MTSFLSQPWRTLGELDRLLCPDALTALLRDAGLDVSAARPDFIRLKPGSGALVGTQLEFRGGDGGTVRIPGYIRTHEAVRAAQLARKWHPGRTVPTSVGAGVRLLPGGRSVLFLFPNDAAVRGMRFVADVDKLKRTLAGLDTVAGGRFRVMGRRSQLATVRYKPERRLILRARLRLKDDAAGEQIKRRIFLRFFTDRRGEGLYRMALAMSRQSVGGRVPAPCGVMLGGRLLIEEDVGGEPLLPRFLAGAAEAGAIAELLARLHATVVDDLPEHGVPEVVGRAEERCGDLACLAPALAGRVGRLAERLRAAAPRDHRRATVHGDCHLHQFRVDRSGPLLVDFERSARGHPWLDIGHLCAHAASLALREPAAADVAARFEGELVEHARRLAPEHGIAELPFFVGAGLLERALLPFRNLEPDWEQRCADILELACERLDVASSPLTGRPRFFAGDRFGVFHPRSTSPWPGRRSGRDGRLCYGTYDPGADRFTELDPTRDRRLPALGELAPQGELLAYRAGQRATLRTGDGAAVVKVVRPGRAAAIAAGYRCTRSRSVRRGAPFPRAPDVRSADLQRGVLVLERLPGVSFHDRIRASWPPQADVVARVARGLVAFHRECASGDGFATRGAPRSPETWIGFVAPHDPQLAVRARAVLGTLRDHAAAATPTSHTDANRLVHGDLHDRNILLDGDRIALIDLDGVGPGDPAEDVGNLAAHLLLRALQQERGAAAGWRQVQRFVEAYLAAGGEADRHRIATGVAFTLLRLGCLYRFRHRWRSLCAPLLDEAVSAGRALAGTEVR